MSPENSVVSQTTMLAEQQHPTRFACSTSVLGAPPDDKDNGHMHDHRKMEAVSPNDPPIKITINQEARVSVVIAGAWRNSVLARRLTVSGVATIAVLTCYLNQAEDIKDGANAANGRAGQNDPVRRRSTVEALGRWVVNQYSDKQSAAAGILDVTKAPYSADPTGKKDSTRAIQQAMKDARDARLITFLPGGTYRVSDTITCIQGVVTPDRWPFGQSASPTTQTTAGESSFGYQSDYFPCALIGSRTGHRSTIILAPGSPGFGDSRNPKPVIHFWARWEEDGPGAMKALIEGVHLDPREWNPNGLAPLISYNQMIIDIDLILGKGNPGAVGIDHQAAQGSAIEDVTVDATGAFAGIHKAPGSGGGIHGLTVIGGRYGLYLKGDPFWRGTQPVPVLSNVTLRGQTERAILYDGRGPLTVVGGKIEGAGIQAQAPQDAPWNGAMNFVDTVFRTRKVACAIRSNHSIYLHNVYFEHPSTIVCIEGQPELKGNPGRWTHVAEYAAGATLQYPPELGGALRQDADYLNGHSTSAPERIPQMDFAAPPVDLQSRHAWLTPPSLIEQQGVANVRVAPYGAKGDGKTDDAAAIQRAIDENDAVFLPKGEYRLSRPLILKSHSRLFGISNVLSVLLPMWSRDFLDTDHPAPLIDTVDDPSAITELAFVELRVPVTDPAVYALRWRAGRNSVVRNIRAVATAWEPDAPPALSPMIRIEASGGGRWYDLYQDGWWFQGPDYRHLLVDTTHEPLSFYMLNPEHARSDAQVEFHDAQNISVYSLKAEGIYTVLWINGCRAVRIYGYGGPAAPKPQWPVFRIDNSDDFLLANVNPNPYAPPDPEQLDLNTIWFDALEVAFGSQEVVSHCRQSNWAPDTGKVARCRASGAVQTRPSANCPLKVSP
jgi:hypothetical protein